MRRTVLLQVDFLIGLILVPLGIAIAVEGLILKYTQYGIIGGGFFPFWIGVGLVLGGAGILYTAGVSKEPTSESLKDISLPQMGTLGLLLAYGVCIELFGFLIASAIYLIIAVGLIARFKPVVVLAVVAISCSILWLAFSYWLAIPFPDGLIKVF